MIWLAARIAELAPGRPSRKSCLVSGGSEAVETAFKIAKQYHQGERCKKTERLQDHLALERLSWRDDGRSFGHRLAPVRETIDPRVPGYSFVGNPMSYRNPLGMSVERLRGVLRQPSRKQIQLENLELVAAFIGEPIMQANGAQVPSKN